MLAIDMLLKSSLPGGGHSITKHTGGGLARRSESKTPKYLSKNSNIRKMLKSYPLNNLKVQSKSSKISNLGQIFIFRLRIVPLIIHMNHFSCPLTIVQINIFEEPQNIQPLVFLTIECPPGLFGTLSQTCSAVRTTGFNENTLKKIHIPI